jgi:UDP-N-acetylmuramate--alanine ligase
MSEPGLTGLPDGHYHLVGVAGVGMSALAQALQAAGRRVTGSDRYADKGTTVEAIPQLIHAGVQIVRQDGSGVGCGTRAVIVSTAIESDNPDLAAAGRLGVPILHRAEALARLVEGRRCLAITGTCGKSTVTGMIGWILEQAGYDPNVVNGAPVVNWRSEERIGNTRASRSDLWVIEADESDRSLLQFHPDWAVITNASKDHFGVEETRALFRSFSGQVRGWLLSALDEPSPMAGFAAETGRDGSGFRYGGVEFVTPLPGAHNAENAWLAVRACERLGCDLPVIRQALSRFRGIGRRLERVGGAAGVAVVDDYAHNPAKIAAAWRALAPYHRRVIAIWRPHGYGPLTHMMAELASTFGEVCGDNDRLLLLPVYDAGGTANRSVSTGDLVSRLAGVCRATASLVSPAEAEEAAVAEARPGDVLLVMGARDPDLSPMARRILARLAKR